MALPPLDQIIATFDKLVAEEIVAYGPYQKIEKDCDGYPLEFRICPSLVQKPPHVGASMNVSVDESQKWGPGSDMYCTDDRLKITRLNKTHDFVFNLFCFERPQFLLLTTDSYRRQHEPLDCTDFEAALEVLRSLDEMYIIYNCTVTGGSSREHKHIQVIPGPPRAFDMFTDPEKRLKIPFQSESYHSQATFGCTTGSELLAAYHHLLGRTKEALGLEQHEKVCPHNVVLWKDWMIVIPRRAARHGRAGASAIGMLGTICVTERSLIDEWTKMGFREVFQTVGLPSETAKF